MHNLPFNSSTISMKLRDASASTPKDDRMMPARWQVVYIGLAKTVHVYIYAVYTRKV
jgi:hypothetical protein